MPKGFVKNEELLEETHEMEDLLDFSEIEKGFENFLKKIKNSSLTALVGDFGMGKSTMLHQLANKSNDNEKWVNFDAWKYPNRDNLWEGFILDFAKQVNEEHFEKVKKEVDGKQNNNKKTLVNTIGDITRMPVIKNFNNFFETSPATRVFEIQEIFENFIQRNVKFNKVYVVIEDIDRSGDKGIFFLETLKQFIKSHSFNTQIVCIVPVSNIHFQNSEDKIYQESYWKCVDYVYYFEPKNIDFSKFIEKVFDESSFESNSWHSHIESIIKCFIRKNVTIRDLKRVIRNVNVEYKKTKDSLDVRVLLLFGFIYILSKSKKIERPLLGGNKDSGYLLQTRERYTKLLRQIAENKEGEIQAPVVFVGDAYCKIPKFEDVNSRRSKSRYVLSDKYIKIYPPR